MSKIYFASDFHLGMDALRSSADREQQILRWLDQIRSDASELYLVGDLFDFWFEYQSVVPRGHVRFLGKIAEFTDGGIPVHVFTGNHDMWMSNYFAEELGVILHRNPIIRQFGDKKFMIGHGDGLGPGDHGYKFIKGIFAHPLSQWLYARLHPNFAFKMANFWSNKSRQQAVMKDQWLGKEKEWLVQYSQKKIKEMDLDFLIFGHRHLPIDCLLDNNRSRYINLGDWLYFNSYAVFDGNQVELRFFENEGASPRLV
ncbi:MAG: UDP-2,3-diacylglucosamine diphosphatase [Saprospiraceae bacterium]|nr:UDP-2,3-diacylglucosamine diphosphatase [Saprospiraceae bacterium]